MGGTYNLVFACSVFNRWHNDNCEIVANYTGYHGRETSHDHPVYSRVQCFDILLCKSVIRRLFFPFYSIAVFCTLSGLFVRFGLCSTFVCFALINLFGGSCSFAFVVWAGNAKNLESGVH